ESLVAEAVNVLSRCESLPSASFFCSKTPVSHELAGETFDGNADGVVILTFKRNRHLMARDYNGAPRFGGSADNQRSRFICRYNNVLWKCRLRPCLQAKAR